MDSWRSILKLYSSGPVLYGDHGKPFVEDTKIHFSVSHSKGRGMIVFSNQEIGVDIEPISRSPQKKEEIANRYFSPPEVSLLKSNASIWPRLWTRREAFYKALGTGINRKWNTINLNEDSLTLGGVRFQIKSFQQDSFEISVVYSSLYPKKMKFLKNS